MKSSWFINFLICSVWCWSGCGWFLFLLCSMWSAIEKTWHFEIEWIGSYTNARKVIEKERRWVFFFNHLWAVQDENFMYGFKWEKEVRNPFLTTLPHQLLLFLLFLNVAPSTSATQIFNILFFFLSSNEWHLLLEILAILAWY